VTVSGLLPRQSVFNMMSSPFVRTATASAVADLPDVIIVNITIRICVDTVNIINYDRP
jgi:hypothetical protein